MKTFKIGGIHPADNKLSATSPIQKAELPKIAVFPLGQHIGAPAKAIVQKGDKVKVGQMIAEASGFVSAHIFSSVSGTVLKIDTAIDASGYNKPAIYITVEGDEWLENIDKSLDLITLDDKPKLTSKDIIEKIKGAGIVGMGGACFPCHVKLCPPSDAQPQWIIINAAECEPYLTADHRLMLEHADEIIVGLTLLMKAANVNNGYIAIESNKADAIKLMEEKTSAYNNIEVITLKTKYPQGGEKQLIDAVVNRQVPAPPALPVSVGAIIQNIGTAYAVYEAVMKNKPLIERVVTVTGKDIKSPSNFLTRLGTPISQLIDACGGLPDNTGKIISGGPMMGKALLNTEVPICKGTSGVLIMNEKDASRMEPSNCIRCGKCINVCPMGLEPYLLSDCAELQIWDRLEKEDVTSCIECGSCQYTCPANRSLLDYIRLGKNTVTGIIRSRNTK